MAIAKIYKVAIANVGKVNSLAKASIAKINSLVNTLFTNTYAISKATSTGSGHYITAAIDASSVKGSALLLDQDDAFTISIWVKAGWNSSLNTNIHLWTMTTDGHSSWQTNTIRCYYREDNNRLAFHMGSSESGSYKYLTRMWLFHTNSGIYAASYAAAGLGTTYWSSSNRGYVGNNDFTMITFVKSSGTSSSDIKCYWNATDCGDVDVSSDSDPGNMAMDTSTDRTITIGSTANFNSYIKTGNNNETQYNDFAIWNTALDAENIEAVYNNGAPINLEKDSGNYSSSSNLKMYHKFENSGVDTAGGTGDLTVAGDSNYETL